MLHPAGGLGRAVVASGEARRSGHAIAGADSALPRVGAPIVPRASNNVGAW